MPVFSDATKHEWRIELDGFNLGDVRDETGVDLADLSASGYDTIARDAIALVKVLSVLCADEIKQNELTARQFAKRLTGDAMTAAREAIAAAAERFFPQSEWSAIQSALQQRAEIAEAMMGFEPLRGAMENMPAGMQQGIQEGLQEMIAEATAVASASAPSGRPTSAGGQATTPPTSATDSLENAVSLPED
jgi:hypothetical protein